MGSIQWGGSYSNIIYCKYYYIYIYYIILYYVMLCYIILYCSILYCTILYYIILHYIILQYIPIYCNPISYLPYYIGGSNELLRVSQPIASERPPPTGVRTAMQWSPQLFGGLPRGTAGLKHIVFSWFETCLKRFKMIMSPCTSFTASLGYSLRLGG